MLLSASHESPLGQPAADLVVRPKIEQLRIIFAFSVAPLVPALIASPVLVIPALSNVEFPWSILLMSPFYGYPLAALIGYPIYRVFMRKKWLKFWQVVLAGAFVGSLIPIGLSIPVIVDGITGSAVAATRYRFLTESFQLVALGSAIGAICGFSFWLIALAGTQKTTAS